jgi:hypothetical protein
MLGAGSRPGDDVVVGTGAVGESFASAKESRHAMMVDKAAVCSAVSAARSVSTAQMEQSYAHAGRE